MTLVVSADPPFVGEKTWRLDLMSAGDTLPINDRNVPLNATLLQGLTESLFGTLKLSLRSKDGVLLAEAHYQVELLAHNQWGGAGTMSELLPAFVMPNDPAVDRVLKAASEVLRRSGRPDAIDGYTAQSRERAWEFASAIWAAIGGLRLSYSLPPASFEVQGQKVRTPSQILDGRIATCLDTALLFAAALEQASFNPLIVLTKGHAFVGVWLQPIEFTTLVVEEAAALRRRIDVKDMILFETTLATQSPPASFSQAIAEASRQLEEANEANFHAAIDIRRARMQKIRPLGVAVRSEGVQSEEAPVFSEGLETAPRLPGFDIDAPDDAPTASGRVLQWQRKLLNLTTSNNLLSHRATKSVVRLLCPDPGSLEDLLATGKKVRIIPLPDLGVGGRDEETYRQQTRSSLRDEVANQAMRRGEVLSDMGKDALDAALIELYRKARSDMEEGGSNTLFLALGFLKWKKLATDDNAYRAPLILLPIRLERRNAMAGVTIVAHEDEPRFNLTLLELLRQDFELELPALEGELPKDYSGIDVEGVWAIVRSRIKDIPGFEVVPDVAIGTFSFAKYLMWRDLVDRADQLKDSPVVRHLIERDGSVDIDKGNFPHPDSLDQKIDPAQLFTPLPADSSQLAAVVASAEDRDFVLDGPPGTGKSQTIANIIAHNLALGRRVLFVAEKRAALDVVQRRLADKGLAPFCLELHSAKATKTAVLKQLDRAWTARETLSEAEWMREAGESKRLRDELNSVVSLLHRREPNGWSIHRAIGQTVRDDADRFPKLEFPRGARHSSDQMDAFRDIIRRLGIAYKSVEGLSQDLEGVTRSDWTNEWQEQIVDASRRIPSALDAVEQARDKLAAVTKLPIAAADQQGMARLLRFVELCLGFHGKDVRFAFAPDLSERVAAARESAKLADAYRRDEAALSAPYVAEAARRVDLDGFKKAYAEAGTKFWFLAKLAQKKVARSLADAGGVSAPVNPAADLPRLGAMRDVLTRLDTLAPLASGIPGWAGLSSDGAQIEYAIQLGEKLRSAIAAEADSPEALLAMRGATSTLVFEANEILGAEGPVAVAALRLRQALDHFDTILTDFTRLAGGVDSPDLDALRARADQISKNGRRLRDWTAWRRVRMEAMQADMASIVVGLESGQVSANRVLEVFEAAYARWFAFGRIDEEPLLRDFMSGEHEDRIERFRVLDDRMSDLASRYIRAKLCGQIPDKNVVGKKDGYGTLKHQLQLQKPSMPIRKLAAEMGDAFTRLAPCMLMSPLSIAQYLPANQAMFDLVIFDEASQIPPWDAIGAMARGKRVIIAGDPRQMPPSNDFARAAGGAPADDDTTPDMPSILDECLAAGVPKHSLDWHYRSRHESLICFSNTRYYGSQLVTFPAPETRPSAVTWERVQGVYTPGARTNPVEAQALVDEAVRRLRDPSFVDDRGNPLSLGIITMNAEQMRLVEDLLDRARRIYPEIEPHFDADTRLEPVCIRNLETVQGDERDLILLGINFGPTVPSGTTMSMTFGKLNANGGWRRLNVAVTRARREMKVFSSFDPGMIDLTRTSAEGVRDLKAFIEYADRGPRALAEANKGSMGAADSPFEEAVTAALRDRGWTLIPQVGVSKFRIDMGLVHPDRPGDFLVGIECDGATYHSAATARDRDKVRASILKGLGWSLIRVWSTDWWIDKQRATDILHAKIEETLAADRLAVQERTLREAEARAEQEARQQLEREADEARAQAIGAGIDVNPIADGPEPAAQPESATALPFSDPDSAAAEGFIARSDRKDRYVVADFSRLSVLANPDLFYDPGYDATLTALIDYVLAKEAPIAERQLVQRVARAHGFQRAGRVIRDRVMSVAGMHYLIDQEDGGGQFVWLDSAQRESWNIARSPTRPEEIRPIEDIHLDEIRIARDEVADPVEVARLFGIRRLSAASRQRIENA